MAVVPWNGIGLMRLALSSWVGGIATRGGIVICFLGVCNGAMACCHWNEDGVVRYDSDGGSIADTKDKTTLEYIILGRKTEGEAEDII